MSSDPTKHDFEYIVTTGDDVKLYFCRKCHMKTRVCKRPSATAYTSLEAVQHAFPDCALMIVEGIHES